MNAGEEVYIQAKCPNCADIQLCVEQVRLVICTVMPRSFYEFVCPMCEDTIRKHAGQNEIDLLISVHVPVEQWYIPDEALEMHEGPPLTHEDWYDMRVALGSTDDLASLIDLSTLPPPFSRIKRPST